ncbi:MAG: dynamin family protein [Thermoanaerobaculum sp.]
MQRVVEALFGLASVAEELGLARVAAEARQAAAQASQSRFNVAVLGQFKRGKSSVLNALIGKPLLPTDVLPTTGVVTVVSEGQDGILEITEAHGDCRQGPRETLAELITEERNPHNQKGVLKVTVPCSCSLTEAGVDLVDTPGLGSIFQHSATRTKEFLPRVDVALLVLGLDPPITDQELELAVEASQAASSLWVVINKADLLPPDTQDRVLEFTASALRSKVALPFAGPWPISAKRALEEGSDPGLDRLREELLNLAQEKREAMALASARRALKVLVEQALSHCRLQKHALTAPLAQLEAKIAAFKQQVRHADDLALAAMVRARQAFRLDLAKVRDLERAEESQLLQSVRLVCLKLALGHFTSRQALDRVLQEALPAPVNRALENLATAHWQELHTAFADYSHELKQTFSRLLEPIAALAKDLFDVDIAGFSPPSLPPPAPLPRWDPVIPSLALDWSWVRGLAFQILPRRWRASLSVARGRELAQEWWRRGCGELQTRFAELVEETVRNAQAVIEKRRQQLEQEILTTLENARRAHAQGEAQVAADLARLQRQENELSELFQLAEA